ncbi:hypothetical protein [Caulobacter mirabilis]|uniref:Uncharacterized protein n=1 Tax=Caulobacter mirabilis TaxID=69666 RepID=A0A2D2AY34_9CAUL|nr:hypothetical protein [Caulobacter mirabilis]ATQ42881.1 hypothetical protein CSW64_10900 [Caulobacter mirabilis]
MAKKQTTEFEIQVDGEVYVWWLQRQPRWSNDSKGWEGMAIAVRHQEGQREAVIEFPPGKLPAYGALLKAANIDPKVVARSIQSAIEAGWDPMSRGKTVNIVVDANGE